MDNTSLGEMDLEQIPKEFQPNKHEHKSPWAFVIILIAIVAFGIFWFLENEKEVNPIPIVSTQDIPQNNIVTKQRDITSELEASVGSIEIPDYSSSL